MQPIPSLLHVAGDCSDPAQASGPAPLPDAWSGGGCAAATTAPTAAAAMATAAASASLLSFWRCFLSLCAGSRSCRGV